MCIRDRVAIADNRPDALAYMQKYYQIPKAYTDPHEMLRENQFDVVHICTANNTHKEFSIAALRSGANVLCEKPLALTVKDAEEMFAEADKAGKLLIACQNNRMGPMQEVKKIVESGLLGNVYLSLIHICPGRWSPWTGRASAATGPAVGTSLKASASLSTSTSPGRTRWWTEPA